MRRRNLAASKSETISPPPPRNHEGNSKGCKGAQEGAQSKNNVERGKRNESNSNTYIADYFAKHASIKDQT